MARRGIGIFTSLTATLFVFGASAGPVAAFPAMGGLAPAVDNGVVRVLCKQGTPNCTMLPRNAPKRNKITVGNVGDCIGGPDTCGFHTGIARTTSQHPHPTRPAGSRR